MKYLCFLFISLVICCQPANAGDWLIFVPGGDVGQRWIGPEPIPGTHCPDNSVVLPFAIVNNDFDVHNYKMSTDGKTLEWIDRAAEARAKDLENEDIRPQPSKFQASTNNDINIPWQFKALILPLLIGQLGSDLAVQTWSQIKASSPDYLTPSVIELVEQYAAEANAPLVTPQ